MKPASNDHLTNLPTYQFHPVILFDGVCNLCNGFVQFVITRDPHERFAFASLQSHAAAKLLKGRYQVVDVPESIVLVDGDRLYTQSTAALRVARGLRFPWNLAYAFVIVPKPIRDVVYGWVARNRYQWFGKRDVCMVPTPELRARFLTD